jgi:hypothetical protein
VILFWALALNCGHLFGNEKRKGASREPVRLKVSKYQAGADKFVVVLKWL